MQYYGTRLSENISRREPEGYLLCLNVPVARTGMQEYLPEELGLPAGSGPPGLIPVIRPEEEVFSKETIASFEGIGEEEIEHKLKRQVERIVLFDDHLELEMTNGRKRSWQKR